MAAIGAFLVITVGCYVARSLFVWFAEPWSPGAAAFVRRWWTWAPLAMLCGIALWRLPLVGLPFTAIVTVMLVRSDAVGIWRRAH